MFEGISAIFGNTSEPNATGHYGYDDETTVTGGYGNRRGPPTASPEWHQNRHWQEEQDEDSRERDEESEREDLLDQHVAYYLKHHPEVHAKHNISRIRPGVYNDNGREIMVEWHYAEDPDQQGYLIAIDGPLRQPFSEYMQGNEQGIFYDDKRLGVSALQQIPKGKRLSFGDGNKMYSRLEAMKVAKEQAAVRERAADYVKDGMMVPQYELMEKYKKTISQKLGERRQKRPEPEAKLEQTQPQARGCPPAEAPAPVPVAEAPVVAPPAKSASPPSASEKTKQKQTHGRPKYCAKHDSTEKRKKCKPQNLPCTQCGSVIQTNYKEFALCPTCSEKDHRCMCCGAPAIGAGPSPQPVAPSSPMSARQSTRGQSKSPAHQASPMSPMNLFGNMPDLFGAAKAELQNNSGGLAGGAVASAWQGLSQNRPTSTVMMSPQSNAYASNNAFTSNNAFVSQNAMASQNHYASQTAFTSYNPMASQNVVISRR